MLCWEGAEKLPLEKREKLLFVLLSNYAKSFIVFLKECIKPSQGKPDLPSLPFATTKLEGDGDSQ